MEARLLEALKQDQDIYLTGIYTNKHSLASYQRFLDVNNELAKMFANNEQSTDKYKELEELSTSYQTLYETNNKFFDFICPSVTIPINLPDLPEPLPQYKFICYNEGHMTIEDFYNSLNEITNNTLVITTWDNTCTAKRIDLEKEGWIQSSCGDNEDEIIVFPGFELLSGINPLTILINNAADFYDIVNICLKYKIDYTLSSADSPNNHDGIISILRKETNINKIYFLGNSDDDLDKIIAGLREHCHNYQKSLTLHTHQIDYHRTFKISENERYVNKNIYETS